MGSLGQVDLRSLLGGLVLGFVLGSLRMSIWLIKKGDDTDVVVKAGAKPYFQGLRPDNCSREALIADAFESIYEKGGWLARMQPVTAFYSNATLPTVARKSASGHGSDLGIATQTSLQILQQVIRDYHVESMIDLPCGDVNWIFDSWETDGMLKLYVGLDITKPVVEANAYRLAHHSNKIFRAWDGAACPLPRFVDRNGNERAVDMVHSRDVIQHLPLQQSLRFLCNVFTSGARVFVTTTFPAGKNSEISPGNAYRNNFNEPPFEFPSNASCTWTHPTIEPDLTCVYDLTQPWVATWIKKQNCASQLLAV